MGSLREREWRYRTIAGAPDIEALRAIRETEQERLASTLAVSPIGTAAAALAALHEELIARTLELAEQRLAREGRGVPPVPYAYLLFGSGGRSEMTFASDQDSGIVYDDPDSEEAAAVCRDYFDRLAETVVDSLVALGYPPCEGNVIASNPDWRLPLGAWQHKIDGWFAEPTWEHVRYLLIAADARTAWGDPALGERMKDRFFGDVLASPVIARRMVDNTLRHKVLVGVFGQLLRERYGENAGGLDIKYGAYIPMVNVIRLMAVQAGIRETSTLGRIEALRHAGALSLTDAEEASAAFAFLLRLRLLTATKREDGQWVGSSKIPKEQLTKELARMLKKALRTGKRLQRRAER